MTKHHKMERKVKTERATYTPDELAEVLGVGRKTVYDGLRNGKIPAFRLGKKYVIARTAVAEWLRSGGLAAA